MSTLSPVSDRMSKAWEHYQQVLAECRVLAQANMAIRAELQETDVGFEEARERLREALVASRDSRRGQSSTTPPVP
jgi:hypothetical protein